MDVPEIVSAIGSVASATVAVFAWRASQNSAQAATSLSNIEKARWHADLRPQFEATAHLLDLTEPKQILVMGAVTLVGPDALHRLDKVEITMRASYVAGWNNPGPAVKAKLPYKFHPGEGDTFDPVLLVLDDVVAGDPRMVTVEPVTYQPADGSHRPPLKLMATCHLEDHEPWSVPITISTMVEIQRPNLEALMGTPAAKPTISE